MEDKRVYVTRDTFDNCVDVFPATVGIRKFHGCIDWGAAWQKSFRNLYLSPKREVYAVSLTKSGCRKRFGFYPRKGTAWYINSRGRRSPVDIDFSD